LRAPESKTPITLDPVPTHLGDLKSFSAHGFHRVPKDCFYVSDLDRHEKLPNMVIDPTGRSAYHRPIANSNTTPILQMVNSSSGELAIAPRKLTSFPVPIQIDGRNAVPDSPDKLPARSASRIGALAGAFAQMCESLQDQL
jgi:hypothetical protein